MSEGAEAKPGADTSVKAASQADLEPQWWRPPTVGGPVALDSMATVAGPLLAGFSITLIGVVAQAPANFRWPGVTLLLLACAAVLFVVCVQCGFWARQYLASPGEVLEWHPGTNGEGQRPLREEQRSNAGAYVGWSGRARLGYRYGLFGLLGGVATALMPNATGDGAIQPVWRWIASSLVIAMLLFELFWAYGRDLRKVPGVRRSAVVKKVVWLWFMPIPPDQRVGTSNKKVEAKDVDA